MKLTRTKNSIKGLASGITNKILLLLIPFVVRTIFIHTLGVEYLGLNSLFASVIDILSLAELGIGSAIVFHLYKEVAENNTKKIAAYINFYKKVYRIIGTIILTIGLLIIPILKYISKTDIPQDVDITVIYLLFLFNTVIPYFLFTYKTSILMAYQENYIINNINTLMKVLLNIFQAVFLLLGQHYYFYVILLLTFTTIENIATAIYSKIKHPNILASGNLSKAEQKEIFKKVKALFLYRIGGIVLASVDSIIISATLGLAILGKYNNYYYVISALFGFFQIFNQSILAGVGNSVATESIGKNKKDFDILNFSLGWVVCFCTICLLCLYQPFITLWIGEKYLFDIGVVILLSIYFYVWKMMEIVNVYKDATGLWEYDQYRPIVASTINLVLNIILVKYIGIYGIIISTIVSILFIIFPWSSYTLFNKYFQYGFGKFLKGYMYNAIQTIIIAIITLYLCNIFNGSTLLNFIFSTIICIFVPNILFIAFNYKRKIYKETINWILQKIKQIKN